MIKPNARLVSSKRIGLVIGMLRYKHRCFTDDDEKSSGHETCLSLRKLSKLMMQQYSQFT
jgi:hypothetical protein